MVEYDSPVIDLSLFVLPENIRKSYNPDVLCPGCRKSSSSTTLGGNGKLKPATWQEEEMMALRDLVKPRKRIKVEDQIVHYCRNKDCCLYLKRF